MNTNLAPLSTAPQRQLNMTGTRSSDIILNLATKRLSNDELRHLEEELTFFSTTGLVGIYMSRLMSGLQATVDQAA